MARVRVLETEKRSPARRETDAALNLAQRLPRLVLEARRAAATLTHGIHGRRRAGIGETFWQFRPFVTGEAAQRVDWRRSARDDRLYVREREWEAAQSVWLWIDRSASMGYVSSLAQAPKIERALVLGMALADTFVNAGERVGVLGLMRGPRLAPDRREDRRGDRRRSLQPRRRPAAARADRAFRRGGADQRLPLPGRRHRGGRSRASPGRGARGHLVMIVDPVEETFPFSGQAVLHEPEVGLQLRVGDAGSWGATYRDRIKLHRERSRDIARRRGWTFTVHHTDRPATRGGASGRHARAGGARRPYRPGRGHRGLTIMLGLPLTFAAPLVLTALAALPVIWLILRVTPPRPRRIDFPPLRILADLLPKRETPARTPWWLLALRLLHRRAPHPCRRRAGLEPAAERRTAAGRSSSILDNGFPAAHDWRERLNLRDRARRGGGPREPRRRGARDRREAVRAPAAQPGRGARAAARREAAAASRRPAGPSRLHRALPRRRLRMPPSFGSTMAWPALMDRLSSRASPAWPEPLRDRAQGRARAGARARRGGERGRRI